MRKAGNFNFEGGLERTVNASINRSAHCQDSRAQAPQAHRQASARSWRLRERENERHAWARSTAVSRRLRRAVSERTASAFSVSTGRAERALVQRPTDRTTGLLNLLPPPAVQTPPGATECSELRPRVASADRKNRTQRPKSRSKSRSHRAEPTADDSAAAELLCASVCSLSLSSGDVEDSVRDAHNSGHGLRDDGGGHFCDSRAGTGARTMHAST